MATAISDAPPRRSMMGRLFRGLLFLIGSAALLGAGFAAGFLYFANPLSPAQDVLKLIEKSSAPADAAHDPAADPAAEGEPKKVPRATPDKEAFVTSYYNFTEPLTSNLAGSRRFLQVGIGLSTEYDQTVLDHVKTHELALRSAMLTVISGFTEQDIDGKAGREKLAQALCDEINAKLVELEGFGGISSVFFPSFMLQ